MWENNFGIIINTNTYTQIRDDRKYFIIKNLEEKK